MSLDPSRQQDWNPRAPEVLADPLGTYDRMRRECPVAWSDYLQHSVFRHADVMRMLEDHDTFSSRVSVHVAVPNGMDPPEHGAWRRVLEPYFTPARIAEYEPTCRRICAALVAGLPRGEELELMLALAHPFALRMQCAFLGWPDSMHAPLLRWIQRKNAATLSGEREATAAVALEFDATIRALLAERRALGESAPDDVTDRLMRETINGRPVTEAEIVSILRNWTVGELGTIAAAVGIIARFLALHPGLQDELRAHPEQVRAANDEILRIEAPLLANRRTPTCPVTMGGRRIEPGERITFFWAAANRDEAVFDDPLQFRPDRDPALNLLYGAGIHVCPGAPLARLELEAIVQALLAGSRQIRLVESRPPLPAVFPAGGYRELALRID